MTQHHTYSQQRIQLGEGISIPAIGLGTWPLTGEDATDAVARGIANGYRHVDTAHSYANEAAVGDGIARSGIRRDQLWVTSKLSLEGHSRTKVKDAYAGALERMGLDYLDLFLIHWPNPEHGRYVDTCQGLAELVADGALRAWGVSNFKPAHLDAVYAAGLRPSVNQVQVDPEHLQRAQLEHHRTLGLVTAAYSPLGRAGDFLEHPAITAAAARYGKSPAQVVLRWHVDSGRIAVPKSASDTRQRENLEIFDFTLSEDEISAINALDTGAGPRLDSDEYGH
ncbi:aldo/keto reductase [Glutamicibacter sp. MNS18]|uniref:aldo/keto reductase n=1 Tax=Glutamicibacter sp. MNS18 TaxID=2989817 RepID=UPI00223681D8|nr:aldo/keto reductase [Glutamicibacter sp. MNS18]MCW4464734.1 aldo/keto reductase [Glutamicibacter sp. MNS18]